MAKRFIVFALMFMLVCAVFLVSCNPDPAKSSKALGGWEAKWEIKDAPEPSYVLLPIIPIVRLSSMVCIRMHLR
ncbi:MAG: hypothetical protein J5891_02885, partial [Spirochaetales bacterium]|nr:hypothetical protein [Spirochaetales bacterium]